MVSRADLSGKFAYDTKGLDQLRQNSRQDSPQALKETAQQFEALFLNMVMKSMREATPHEGVFNSEQEKMMTSMLDQQMSQTLAKRGVGLADVLVRQLSNKIQTQDAANGVGNTGATNASAAANGNNGGLKLDFNLSPRAAQNAVGAGNGANATNAANPTTLANAAANGIGAGGRQAQISRIEALNNELSKDPNARPFLPGRLGNMAHLYLDNQRLDAVARADGKLPALIEGTALAGSTSSVRNQPGHVRAFQERMGKHAEQVSRETGIPAKFMLGQAALESGWGKREIITADGKLSHNLFGIKATAGWKGKTAEAVTTEYVNGVPYTRREKFRVYDSYAEGFKDYGKLISKNPRYEHLMTQSQDASSFAKGLQKAGYATDPHYASKLTKIINQNLI
ncbi:MAG: flagellar assembly peptidoglycan hydrolase FlgJ [Pseudomonadota bacterium]